MNSGVKTDLKVRLGIWSTFREIYTPRTTSASIQFDSTREEYPIMAQICKPSSVSSALEYELRLGLGNILTYQEIYTTPHLLRFDSTRIPNHCPGFQSSLVYLHDIDPENSTPCFSCRTLWKAAATTLRFDLLPSSEPLIQHPTSLPTVLFPPLRFSHLCELPVYHSWRAPRYRLSIFDVLLSRWTSCCADVWSHFGILFLEFSTWDFGDLHLKSKRNNTEKAKSSIFHQIKLDCGQVVKSDLDPAGIEGGSYHSTHTHLEINKRRYQAASPFPHR